MDFGPHLQTFDPNVIALFRHDLRDEINAELAELAERGDELYAHVSDVYGCDRQSWARRSGIPFLLRDPATNWKLAMGHAVEEYVANAIGKLLLAQQPTTILIDGKPTSITWPLAFTRNERLAWNPYTGQTRRHLLAPGHGDPFSDPFEPCEGCVRCRPEENELIGHVDLQLQGDSNTLAVGEIKSVWFGKELPTIAEPRYIQQAASYAEAVRAEDFFVQVLAVTIRGGKTALELSPTFWFKTANHRAWVIDRAREVIEATRPTSFEPAAKPPTDWWCRVCGYTACPLNSNPRNPRG